MNTRPIVTPEISRNKRSIMLTLDACTALNHRHTQMDG
jgi:hypothetical protein